MKLFEARRKKEEEERAHCMSEPLCEEFLRGIDASECEDALTVNAGEVFPDLAEFGDKLFSGHRIIGNTGGTDYEMLFPLFIKKNEKDKEPSFEGSILKLKGLSTGCRDIFGYSGQPLAKPASRGGYTLRRYYSGLGFCMEGHPFLNRMTQREYVVSEALANWLSMCWSCFKPKAYMVAFNDGELTVYFYGNCIRTPEEYAKGLKRIIERMPDELICVSLPENEAKGKPSAALEGAK